MVLDTSCSFRTFLLAHRNCLSFMVRFLFQMVPGMNILESTQGCSRKQIKQGPFLHEHYYHSLVFQLLSGRLELANFNLGGGSKDTTPYARGLEPSYYFAYYSQIFAFLHMHSSVLILHGENHISEFYSG